MSGICDSKYENAVDCADSSAVPPIGNAYYQSPLNLRFQDTTFHVKQKTKLKGRNTGATFNDFTHNYDIDPDNKIFLKLGKRTYRLQEFHFHVDPVLGSEHAIEGHKADAEVHYVFAGVESEKSVRLSENISNVATFVLGRRNQELIMSSSDVWFDFLNADVKICRSTASVCQVNGLHATMEP